MSEKFIKINGVATTVVTPEEKAEWNGKQDKLTAGDNVAISGNTINASDTTYNLATSTNNGLMSASDKSQISKIDNKVDKVSGKVLSTNDYTNADKAKVGAIPEDPKYTDTTYSLATQTTNGLLSSVDKVKIDAIPNSPKYTDTTYGLATTTTDGLMSKGDKVKLNEMQSATSYTGDLNTLTTLGVYSCKDNTNRPPEGGNRATCYVSKANAATSSTHTDTIQIWVNENDSIFIRNSVGKSNEWTAWKKTGDVPVVNNLTSGGATNALSAEQGVVLNADKVSKSGDEITGNIIQKNIQTLTETSFGKCKMAFSGSGGIEYDLTTDGLSWKNKDGIVFGTLGVYTSTAKNENASNTNHLIAIQVGDKNGLNDPGRISITKNSVIVTGELFIGLNKALTDKIETVSDAWGTAVKVGKVVTVYPNPIPSLPEVTTTLPPGWRPAKNTFAFGQKYNPSYGMHPEYIVVTEVKSNGELTAYCAVIEGLRVGGFHVTYVATN